MNINRLGGEHTNGAGEVGWFGRLSLKLCTWSHDPAPQQRSRSKKLCEWSPDPAPRRLDARSVENANPALFVVSRPPSPRRRAIGTRPARPQCSRRWSTQLCAWSPDPAPRRLDNIRRSARTLPPLWSPDDLHGDGALWRFAQREPQCPRRWSTKLCAWSPDPAPRRLDNIRRSARTLPRLWSPDHLHGDGALWRFALREPQCPRRWSGDHKQDADDAEFLPKRHDSAVRGHETRAQLTRKLIPEGSRGHRKTCALNFDFRLPTSDL